VTALILALVFVWVLAQIVYLSWSAVILASANRIFPTGSPQGAEAS